MTFKRVEGNTEIFIREEFGAKDPNFLSIISSTLNLQLVYKCHEIDLLTYLLLRCVASCDGALGIKAVESPEIAVVVTV